MRRRMLLTTAALCLIVQGAFALPDCRCAEREDVPPCHQQDRTPERSSCCSGEKAPADACTAAMQAGCCDSGAAPAAETAAVQLAGDGGSDVVLHARGESAPGRVAMVPARIELPDAPDPPRVPTWILNSTLRN